MRWWLARRVCAALLCLGVVLTCMTRWHEFRIAMWVVRAGESWGYRCQWVSGQLVTSAAGPFYGAGWSVAAWNFTYRNGPWAACTLTAYGAAMGVYGLSAGPLAATRVFRYRGRTVCGACGYDLRGTVDRRCPECGKSL